MAGYLCKSPQSKPPVPSARIQVLRQRLLVQQKKLACLQSGDPKLTKKQRSHQAAMRKGLETRIRETIQELKAFEYVTKGNK